MADPHPVLITGGAGYIGSHAVLACHDADIPVVVLDDLSTGRRERLPEEVPFIEGNAGGFVVRMARRWVTGMRKCAMHSKSSWKHLMAGSKEDAETVSAFFQGMRARGLRSLADPAFGFGPRATEVAQGTRFQTVGACSVSQHPFYH